MAKNRELVDFHIKIPKEIKRQIQLSCIYKNVTMKDLTLEIFKEN